MTTPDFLTIGHAVKDLVPGGWRLGGSVTYASAQVSRLGLKTAVVTRSSDELRIEQSLSGVEVRRVPSPISTTFENRYERGRRVQRVREQAPPIGAEHVPHEWRATPVVLIAPVLGEVPLGLARLFSRSFVGFSPQGWLRQVRKDGLVTPRGWDSRASMKGASVIVVSEEDIQGHEAALERWTDDVGIVVVTCGERGARIHSAGRWLRIDAFAWDSPDTTGAGDVFAAAFMVALHEGRDVGAAARFASAAAALGIRAPGIDSIASRDEIEALLAGHPEVMLQ